MNLLFPSPRQQFVEMVDGMSVDHPLQHVAQVSIGFDAVELAAFNQRADDCPPFASAVAAGEEMVFPAERHRADCTLDRIGVQFNAAIVQEARQTVPTGERVPDRFRKRAAAGHACKLRLKPGLQGLHDRLREGAPLSEPMGRRLPTNAGFNGIELTDPAQGFRRYGRTGGLGNFVELASCMGPTCREHDVAVHAGHL